MKKYFYIVAMFVCMTAQGKNQTAANRLSDFIVMEKGHKDDWFDLKKSAVDQKIELKKKHVDECADLKSQHVAEASDIQTGADVEKAMAKHLKDAIALHKRQNQEWEAFAKSAYAKKQALCAKHKKDLTTFEKKA